MKRSTFLKATVAAASASCLAPLGHAQAYPTKPVRLLVGFVAGGGTDSIARQFGRELQSVLGQTVVVENRPGANGMIATQELVKAPADGHTIMLTISSHITNGLLYKTAYDPQRDITPLSVIATVPFVLTARPSLKFENLGDLLRAAKARPDTLTYGSAGSGSPPHLFQELFDQMGGTRTRHVSYKGSATAMTDLLAGHIDLLWLTTVQALPFLKDGKLTPLVVSTPTRSPVVPNVPAAAEAGVPGFDADMWWGFIAPPGAPEPVAAALQKALATIVASRGMRESLLAQGAVPVGGTQAEFRSLLAREHVKWERIVRERGIKATE